jgi:hypothetical protein
MGAEDEALNACKVGKQAHSGKAMLAGDVGDGLALIMADL